MIMVESVLLSLISAIFMSVIALFFGHYWHFFDCQSGGFSFSLLFSLCAPLIQSVS